jgi:uncharacterized membrane protein
MDYMLERHLDAALESARPPATAVPLAPAAVAARPRLNGIDFLRGLVMAIMVLDHARDFLGVSGMNPRDVHEPALFLTRWITHFCAPVFVFLAGISAWLYASRGRTRGELSRYLLTRGLWLVLIEHTVVRFGWTFSLSADFLLFQVIWAIGASMVVLAGLVWLPRGAIAAVGLALVFGHNLLDGIKADGFGSMAWLWMFLHEPGMLQPAPGVKAFALYSLIPWAGVLALGYVVGPVMLRESERRREWLLVAGIATIAGFVLLRASNLYGDPAPWVAGEGLVADVLSFINAEKYPPSLLYLAMTLGPALLLLALFSGTRGALTRAIVTIGRVPFLFYVAHIFLLHAMAVAAAALFFGDTAWLFVGMPLLSKPEGYGFALPAVYAAWIVAVVALYPLCRWFAALKQRRKDWWLSYL